jgi:hypothetical protein
MVVSDQAFASRRVAADGVGSPDDDDCVATEVETRPLSVRDAARAVREARDATRRHGAAYARLRTGLDKRATTRAHNEFSFAILEFVNACVALAEAEDRVDPVWAAARNHGQPMSTVAGPDCDQAWCDYQVVRQSGDRDAIEAARHVWRDAFVDWQLQLHKRRVVEDQDHAEKVSRRLDDSKRLHPGDAFPPPPRSRSESLVRESRERAPRVDPPGNTGPDPPRARLLSDPWDLLNPRRSSPPGEFGP